MSDSPSPETERPVQPLFRKFNIFSYLLLGAVVVAGHYWFISTPNRSDQPDALVSVRYSPVRFEAAGFAPLVLVGVWRVEVDDARFGGVSALAIGQSGLLALTDSGTVINLPRPGQGQRAFLRDLPDGPGNPRFKRHRDSEALVRDPQGRGWWVAFEQWHQLWLFDLDFSRALRRVDFGRDRWRANKGIEGMVADRQGLTVFPEPGMEWLRLDAEGAVSRPLANRFGYIAEAARTPDGRLILVARELTLAGLAKRLVFVDEKAGTLALHPLARLELGATANVEAIVAEPGPVAGTRLWLMTDNDFRPRTPTLLVALDLPQQD